MSAAVAQEKTLPGKPYGSWTVIERVSDSPKGWGRRWLCRCVCGEERIVLQAALRSGHSHSCGCSRATHGEAARTTPEYRAWKAMCSRCRSPKDPHYPDYGGRGISVCERWLDYESFLGDVGRRPGADYSLDRFPNNDGNYEPGNVRWATALQQSRNRRSLRLLEVEGVTKQLVEWSEISGVPVTTIYDRYFRGKTKRRWSAREAVFRPVGEQRRGIAA